MIKIVKTTCLLGVLTLITHTDLVASKNYSNTLFDIINNKKLTMFGKKMAVEEICANSNPNVNALDPDGYTLLHKTIETGSIPILRLLIEKGANINAKNDIRKNPTWRAYTPLQWAFLKKKPAMASFIIKCCKPCINTKASDGSTIFHIAAKMGYHRIIVKALKTNYGLMHKTDFAGNTPAHMAASSANKKILTILVQNSIDFTAKNKEGFTVKDILVFWCNYPDPFKQLEEKKERFVKCYAYLQLVTDFLSTLKTMQEEPSMFKCFNEDHINETFDRFVKKHLSGKDAKKNSKDIKNILHFDKQQYFTKSFRNWYEKQRSSAWATPTI